MVGVVFRHCIHLHTVLRRGVWRFSTFVLGRFPRGGWLMRFGAAVSEAQVRAREKPMG